MCGKAGVTCCTFISIGGAICTIQAYTQKNFQESKRPKLVYDCIRLKSIICLFLFFVASVGLSISPWLQVWIKLLLQYYQDSIFQQYAYTAKTNCYVSYVLSGLNFRFIQTWNGFLSNKAYTGLVAVNQSPGFSTFTEIDFYFTFI